MPMFCLPRGLPNIYYFLEDSSFKKYHCENYTYGDMTDEERQTFIASYVAGSQTADILDPAFEMFYIYSNERFDKNQYGNNAIQRETKMNVIRSEPHWKF